jgi:hypothetical protein
VLRQTVTAAELSTDVRGEIAAAERLPLCGSSSKRP